MSEAQQHARISFLTPPDKRKRLEALAKTSGKNLSGVINEALDQYIDLYEWQLADIRAGIVEADAGHFVTDEEAQAFFDSLRQ